MSTQTISTAKTSGLSTVLHSLKRRVKRLVDNASRVPVGTVRWGDLRNLHPICSEFGFSRGKPVDRHFVEAFLSEHAADVSGRVLEIKDPGYTLRFGGSRVEQSDVLDINPTNPDATIVADLNDASALANDTYDCVVFTQTLQFIAEPANALRNLHRSLKPGGVLLLTAPGITPLRSRDHWYWNFTDRGVENLLGELFAPSDFLVRTFGNLVSTTAFLHGLSAGELEDSELASCDPAYQLLIAARAVKARP